MAADYAKLQDIIGHNFMDIEHLKLALRHASTTTQRTKSNERLEFLGDRVLGLSIAELLYKKFPNEDEGHLARRFAGLTSKEALARVAGELNLDGFVHIQAGDAETQKRSKLSILADTLEAVLGAMYLDGGLPPPQNFISNHWQSLIDQDLSAPKDAKTALQEWAQARGFGLPVYKILQQHGPDHAPIFTLQVNVQGIDPQVGEGRSRRLAEQAAAQNLLEALEIRE